MLYNLKNKLKNNFKSNGVYNYKKNAEINLKKASQSYEEIFITSFFL
ncbi:MAG: hypothetical protein ACQEQE_10920 [Bacillota bacterium]